MTFPDPIPPMLATPGTLPPGPGWAYEFKWDGVRAVVYIGKAGVRILSRNERDATASYPDVAAAMGVLGGRPMILDGEIVALNDRGHPSFARLQRRMNVRTPTDALVAGTPLTYHVFDVLALDGKRAITRPYAERRDLLAGLHGIDIPPSITDEAPDRVAAEARAAGMEGVVAKRLDAPYQPGIRSPDWIKAPFIRTQEVVVIGWKPGAGRRAGTIGSLLLGVHTPAGELSFAGGVGTGFTDAVLHDLQERLAPLRQDSPAAPDVPRSMAHGAEWVSPEVVGEVEYRSWTPDGRLRHSSWRGLRPDRRPDEAVSDRSIT
jgi:bifunctional non-homologous end joining protein LigD